MSAKVKDLRSPCLKRWASFILGLLEDLMSFQAVSQHCLENALNLAQQLMRNITNFKAAT
jgi:hypothetical protein